MRNLPKMVLVATLVGLGLWAFERSLTPAMEPPRVTSQSPAARPLPVVVHPWVEHQPPKPAPEPAPATPEAPAPVESASEPEGVPEPIPEPDWQPAPEIIGEPDPPLDLDWEYYQEAAMELEMSLEAEGDWIPYEEEVMEPPPRPEPDPFEPGF